MFPLLLKKRLLPPCCSSLLSSQVRSLLIRFPVIKFLSPPPPPPPPLPQPPQVLVWWDSDSCGVPSGVSFWKVAPSIMAAVRVNGIKGTIDIHAYGQFLNISDVDHDALWQTSIYIHPVWGGKNYTSKHLLQALSNWVSRNPPPAHLFLISDFIYNRDLSSILHGLRMSNYNILTACPGRASDILCNATTIMWNWSSMLKGEDLTGKHFNYPPSGSFNSWYGDSKVPLENPFSAAELFEDSNSSEVDQQGGSGQLKSFRSEELADGPN